MTQIPPKIKKLPDLRQPQTGYIANSAPTRRSPSKSLVKPPKLVR